MNHNNALGQFAAATSALILSLAYPPLSAGQNLPSKPEQQPGPLEEVIVWGSQSLIRLEFEAFKAEENFYDLFNAINTDDDLDVRCEKVASVGTHIKHRECTTKRQRELMSIAAQRMMRGEHYRPPVAELEQTQKRLLDQMTRQTLEHPELLEALNEAREARHVVESERQRRCEDKILFCW